MILVYLSIYLYLCTYISLIRSEILYIVPTKIICLNIFSWTFMLREHLLQYNMWLDTYYLYFYNSDYSKANRLASLFRKTFTFRILLYLLYPKITIILRWRYFQKNKAFIAFFGHSSPLKTISRSYNSLKKMDNLFIPSFSPEKPIITLEVLFSELSIFSRCSSGFFNSCSYSFYFFFDTKVLQE